MSSRAESASSAREKKAKETDKEGDGNSGSEGADDEEQSEAGSGLDSEEEDDDDSMELEEGEEEELKEDDEEIDIDGHGIQAVLEVNTAAQRALQSRVKGLCSIVDEKFPAKHPTRTVQEQLDRLPPEVPLLMTHSSIPMMMQVAEAAGIFVHEESAISIKDGELMEQLRASLSTPFTWVLFDVADLSDFEELLEALQFFLSKELTKKRQQNKAGYGRREASAARSTGLANSTFGSAIGRNFEEFSGGGGEHQEPSRLILYSSSEGSEIPRNILRLCFCIQSVVSFFGIRSEPAEDASDGASDDDYPDIERAGTPAFFGLQVPDSSDSDEEAEESSDSDESVQSMEEAIRRGFGTDAGPAGTDWQTLLGPDAPILLQEILGYLSHVHPLLTARPSGSESERTGMVMGAITLGCKAADVEGLSDIAKCSSENVPEWVEESVVLRARSFVHKNSILAVLQNFAPSLVRRTDNEVREIMSMVSGKLCGLLQNATAAVSILTSDSPFWLRLELQRAVQGLQAARADIMACYGALFGDVSWNSHLYDVYTAAAYGRAYWGDGRPLASWLASLTDHVNFLTAWQERQPPDAAPFRLGSVSSISFILSSYFKEGGYYHLRLEKRPEQKGKLNQLKEGDVFKRAAQYQRTRTSELTTSSASTPMPGSERSDSRSEAPDSPRLQTGTPTLMRGSLQSGGRDRDMTQSPTIKEDSPSLIVEGLYLVGGTWRGDKIAKDHKETYYEYEAELPAMCVRLVKGTPPSGDGWYLCPFIIAHPDAFGNDLAGSPIAHVFVRTALSPMLCALRGVRIVSHG
eukprot:TRINITY_DN2817_c2_g1_i1.p1 TRINITY_DN2817_c2_g1~~TRINITY_DN2817_c2_g1_i1.p1  ORF type:complete len:911 (-),score=174.54 TRINITY_DN2817_c2_g1_i1:500-2914(-)